MGHPSWCGSGHEFTDETGVPWHSGSSVEEPDADQSICQAPGALQQLGSGSSLQAASHWGLVTTQGTVIHPDMWVTVLWHMVGLQPCTCTDPACAEAALHALVGSEG